MHRKYCRTLKSYQHQYFAKRCTIPDIYLIKIKKVAPPPLFLFLFRYTCNKFSIKWNIYSHNLYEPFDSKFRPRWWTWWFFSMFEIFFVLFERIWNTTSYNVFLFVRNWKFRGYINWIYQTNRLGTRAIHVSNMQLQQVLLAFIYWCRSL